MKDLGKRKKIILRDLISKFFVSRNIITEFIQKSNFLLDGFGYFCWIALEKKFTKSVYYDIGFILNIKKIEKNNNALSRFYRKKILLKIEKQIRFFPPSVFSNKIPQFNEIFKLIKETCLCKKIYNSFVFKKEKFIEIKNLTNRYVTLDKIYFMSLISRFNTKTNLKGSIVF
ncbi:hypothetical protein CMESO_271 (nucleomorph) [Chroomonas mesostigmatica CCMP1168]|uniref:Uncharacterized protein n=1 Tax=Chroomonas mesostigmatica CCMP1168 TaxID=1195612 RepID=J7G824_9CRYP|nr:hypothetical protein CMESO_271 [Chroomonas mesostigmatica CCMP1168]